MVLRIDSVPELLGAVPHLLGYVPSQQIVFCAIADNGQCGGIAAQLDDVDSALPDILRALAARQTRHVLLIAYGEQQPADIALVTAAIALTTADIPLLRRVRVTGDRWFAHHCDQPRCCPPDGHPYTPSTSVAAATLVVQGLPALPSRADHAHRLVSPPGPHLFTMARETTAARARVEELLATSVRLLISEATDDLDSMIADIAAGRPISDRTAAWMSLALHNSGVLNLAQRHIAAHAAAGDAHVEAWADLTRRAVVGYRSAVATLCALAAYLSHQVPLAEHALRIALTDTPGYRHALVLWTVFEQLTTPEEIITLLTAPPTADGDSASRPRAAGA